MSDNQWDLQDRQLTLCIIDFAVRRIKARLDISEAIRHVLIGSVELVDSIIN